MDDDILRQYLDRMRDIAHLPDEEALEEILAFIDDVRTDRVWHVENAKDRIARLVENAKHLANLVAKKAPIDFFLLHDVQREAQELGTRWPPEIRSELAGDISEARQKALDMVEQAEIRQALDSIDSCLTEAIVNTIVADRILRDLAFAEERLRERARELEIAGKVRRGRERVARFRADKKLAEAEVVEAGGNAKKAARLRAEAAVMLKQDWLRAFPNESPPASG